MRTVEEEAVVVREAPVAHRAYGPRGAGACPKSYGLEPQSGEGSKPRPPTPGSYENGLGQGVKAVGTHGQRKRC